MDAFHEGFEAFLEGRDIDSNPYPEKDMRRDEWDDGFSFGGYESIRRFDLGKSLLNDLTTQ